jgi:DNA-binding response OmpR family regulator
VDAESGTAGTRDISGVERTAILAVVEKDLDLIGRLRAFGEAQRIRMMVARSAQEAILFLRGVGVYSNRAQYPQPSAVLLDSGNLESSDLEVLEWIRENSFFHNLPVGILTHEEAHDLHVLCAIDPASFVVNRTNLFELSDLVAQSSATA